MLVTVDLQELIFEFDHDVGLVGRYFFFNQMKRDFVGPWLLAERHQRVLAFNEIKLNVVNN